MNLFSSFLLCVSLLILTATGSWAQLTGFQYQAVIRDGQSLETNKSVALEFIIKSGTPTGTTVYAETHNTMTDEFGLVNVVIGDGTASTGTFNNVDWGGDDHFLEVRLDGVSLGTTQLLTVPYAKVATDMSIKQLHDVAPAAPSTNQVLRWNGSEWAPADAPSSPWTETGNDVYIDDPNKEVGIGLASPNHLLHIRGEGSSRNPVSIEMISSSASNDAVEIIIPDSVGQGQFLEMQHSPSDVVARVNFDGSAEFTRIQATETLPASTSPTPGTMYANSLPIAYGYVNSSGTVIEGYGVSSIARPATGEFQITLSSTVVGYPIVIANSFGSSPDNEIVVTSSTLNSNVVEVNIEEGGSGSNSFFYFVVFGRTQ